MLESHPRWGVGLGHRGVFEELVVLVQIDRRGIQGWPQQSCKRNMYPQGRIIRDMDPPHNHSKDLGQCKCFYQEQPANCQSEKPCEGNCQYSSSVANEMKRTAHAGKDRGTRDTGIIKWGIHRPVRNKPKETKYQGQVPCLPNGKRS